MTLNTRIYVHGPIGHREVYDKVNEILGIPATRRVYEGPAQWESRKGLYEIGNEGGQGFDAWVETYSDALGGELRQECDAWCDDPCNRCTRIPPHHVLVTLDTGYSHVTRDGKDCTTLHADVIVKLHQWLTERGLSLHWHNEYSGEVFEGLTGLAGFVGHGDQARAWFLNEVQPALHQFMQYNPTA